MAMKVELKEKPKNPTIIEGFPGFGFISTITTEYLMDHLTVRSIGKITSDTLPPMAVIHDNKIMQPLEIFYNEKHNLVIVEAMTGTTGMEWDIAAALADLYAQLNAKEIISIEGIGIPPEKENLTFYHTNQKPKEKEFKELGIMPIQEGVIMGVSGALMLKMDTKFKTSFLFAGTHSKLPDSRAAAEIVKVLDKYLGLKIDTKPLIAKAKKFEEKLRGIVDQTKKALVDKIKKQKKDNVTYIG